MKIETGMYVRTEREIFKFLGVDERGEYRRTLSSNNETVTTGFKIEDVLKASHNIIDLIEVGDVITFKNDNDVYKVICIPNKKHACDCFYLEFNYADKYGVEDIYVSKEDMEETLKSIITKEQFQNIEYRFGD